jgi:hypothetical protein
VSWQERNIAPHQAWFTYRQGAKVTCGRPYAGLGIKLVSHRSPFKLRASVLAMTRKKSAGTKKRAGRKNDFVGKKLRLLSNFATHWRQAVDCDKQSEFYDKITRLGINRWGYHEDYSLLVDEDTNDDNDDDIPSEFSVLDAEDEEVDDDLTAEEADRHQKIYQKLRTVSNFIICHFQPGLKN